MENTIDVSMTQKTGTRIDALRLKTLNNSSVMQISIRSSDSEDDSFSVGTINVGLSDLRAIMSLIDLHLNQFP